MARIELMYLALELLAAVIVIRSAAARIHRWWDARRQRMGNPRS
jgi:hypothetical protein